MPYPVVHFNPPWAEVAALATIAAIILPWAYWLHIKMLRELKQLADQDRMADYFKEHWRTLIRRDAAVTCLLAPLLEELLSRGPVVLLLQYRAGWALILGAALTLNAAFALFHRGEILHNVSKTEHRIFAFCIGAALCVTCLFGLLIVAIIWHALVNYCFGGIRTKLKDARDPDRRIEEAKISVVLSGKVYHFDPEKPETPELDSLNDETE